MMLKADMKRHFMLSYACDKYDIIILKVYSIYYKVVVVVAQ